MGDRNSLFGCIECVNNKVDEVNAEIMLDEG